MLEAVWGPGWKLLLEAVWGLGCKRLLLEELRSTESEARAWWGGSVVGWDWWDVWDVRTIVRSTCCFRAKRAPRTPCLLTGLSHPWHGWRRRRSRSAAPRSRCRSSALPRWSVPALLDQQASLDTSALVRGKVAIGVRKLSGKTVAARRNLLRVVGPLVSGFSVDGTGTPRHDVTGSVVGSGSRRSSRFSVVHRPSAVSMQSLHLNSIEPQHFALSSSSLTSLWRTSSLSGSFHRLR